MSDFIINNLCEAVAQEILMKHSIYHKHHILPRHVGGTNEPENIVELTIEEHAEAHRILYEKYGRREDWLAWKGLCGEIGKDEMIFSRMSIGGSNAQKTLKENNLTPFYNAEQKKKYAHLGGSASQKTLKEKQLTSFYDPEQRKRAASNGGKIGSVLAGMHDSEIQRERGKRGGSKNKGFTYINDGKFDIKYTAKMKEGKSLEVFLEENTQYVVGRLSLGETVTCPHCGKVGKKMHLGRNHFNNCFALTGKKRTFTMKKKVCPHCGHIGAGRWLYKFHFDNCKEKNKEEV